MKEFMIRNWPLLLISAAFLIYIVYLVAKGKWNELRELAYKAMMSAERLFSDSQGKEKMEEVFKAVYQMIPAWLQRFMPPDQMKAKLQEWYYIAKNYLDNGTIDKSNETNTVRVL